MRRDVCRDRPITDIEPIFYNALRELMEAA
jgi:hypothetical protein